MKLFAHPLPLCFSNSTIIMSDGQILSQSLHPIQFSSPVSLSVVKANVPALHRSGMGLLSMGYCTVTGLLKRFLRVIHNENIMASTNLILLTFFAIISYTRLQTYP